MLRDSAAVPWLSLNRLEDDIEKNRKQAGAELCQAQGLAKEG